MPDSDHPLQKLMLGSIERCCAQESELFFRREPHDPRFCFELLRRAILEHNHDAWEMIYTQYRPLVSGWVTRHPGFQDSGEELDYFVNAAFDKFWSALTPDKFLLLSDLKAALRYLQMCVHSVLVDHMRLREHMAIRLEAEQGVDLATGEAPDVSTSMLKRVEQRELWRWIEGRLHDDKERYVVYGSFFLALKSRDLYSQFSKVFRNQAEVYRVKENVLARLRRDPELRRFFDEDAGKTVDASFSEQY